MKKTIILIIIFILLSGCSEVRNAKAYKIRQGEHRKNDIHNARMAEKEALKPTIITIKENLLLTGMAAGITLIVVLTGAFSYYTIGTVITRTKQTNLMLIPLDKSTRQFPLIVLGGKRAYNPNTLASSDLRQDNLPIPHLVDRSTAVMIGAGPRFNSFADYEKCEKFVIESGGDNDFDR